MTAIDGLSNSLTNGRSAVHVGVAPALARHVLDVAKAEGFDCHYLDMSAVNNPQDYYALLEREFEFPTPVVNDHGAMDWMSDLEWLGEFPGHLVVIDGLDHLLANHDGIFRALVYMLPHVIDRMRSGGEVYHAVAVGQSTELINAILAELEEANAFLSAQPAAQSANPSQPAEIVRHDLTT